MGKTIRWGNFKRDPQLERGIGKVDFFKANAKKYKVSYQRMIRQVLQEYVFRKKRAA